MKVALVGPPGSGRATHATAIKEAYAPRQICYLNMTDLMRRAVAERTPNGRRIELANRDGLLLDDDAYVAVVQEHLQRGGFDTSSGTGPGHTHPPFKAQAPTTTIEPDACAAGFILDGFPRTVTQLKLLEQSIGGALDGVIQLELEDERVLDRVSRRWVHKASGRVYHDRVFPPRVPGKDDLTGEPLTQRHDDDPEVVKRRLTRHKEQTTLLRRFLSGDTKESTESASSEGRRSTPTAWLDVDGNGPVDTVRQRLLAALVSVEASSGRRRQRSWKFW